jgi:hypothetical protein
MSSVLIPLLIWNGRRYLALTTRVLIALTGADAPSGNPAGCTARLITGS